MRILRWTWPVFALAVLFVVPWACHRAAPDLPLNVVVLDKTVPFENRIEHRSLFWLLGHLKIVRADGEPYDSASDYLGAYPGPEPGDRPARTADLTDADALTADLLYLVDTYGVYEGDLESGTAMKAALERSPCIYGGLQPAEAAAAARAASAGRTVVVEFNTLASPTPAAARESMESLLGVRWTRWIGRYFARLDDPGEVPRWLRENYEREWRAPWRFRGPGYVLLRDDAHVEVLRTDEEVERLGLTLHRERPLNPVLRDARDGVPYPYWFSIVEPAPDTRVLATFRWSATDAGRRRLRARGLPEAFPAVCLRQPAGAGRTYYLAGDFADNPAPEAAIPLAGYPTFKRWFEGIRLAPSESSFYWQFYVPMMSRLIEQAAAERGPSG